MSYTHSDYSFSAIAAWKEARGDGNTAMLAVLCVIRNRVNKHGSTPFTQVVKPWAFSSITAKGDPELTLWPSESDPTWIQAQLLAQNVLDGLTSDITGGATLYFSPAGMASSSTTEYTLPDGEKTVFPKSWNPSAVVFSSKIGTQLFFREI